MRTPPGAQPEVEETDARKAGAAPPPRAAGEAAEPIGAETGAGSPDAAGEAAERTGGETGAGSRGAAGEAAGRTGGETGAGSPGAAAGGEAAKGSEAAGSSAAPPAAPGGPFTRLRRLPPAAKLALGVLVVAAVVVAVVVLTGGRSALPGVAGVPGTLADPVPYDGRSPGQPAGDETRVLVQLPRKPLGELEDARAMGGEQQAIYIKSLKREQITLRSALEANGIVLRDVVSYYRVYNGFAATVRTQDVGRLNSRGARVRTVRRTYPASGEPVPVDARPPATKPASQGQPPVALLDTGVDPRAVKAHEDPGYDAVDRDSDPAPGKDPAGTGRTETSGTALAGVLAELGERVMPIRVASLRASPSVEAVGTTDELMAGLEKAVDPNGDLDSSDHAAVALVGVNSPYAGFSDSPEAQAVTAAAGLGTLVVAPAGNEGAARPGSGTVGSPAAAPGALAVGALTGPEPAPRAELAAAGETLAQAAVLGGAPAGAKAAGPVTAADPAEFGAQAPKLRGTALIVKAGANPAAQAAAAAAIGARVVILADTRDDRPLPAVAAGRAVAPVVGVTGEAAQKVLAIKPGTEISFGEVERGPRGEQPAVHASAYTSEGPSAGGLAKPDVADAGSALTLTAGGKAAVSGGSAIAAARVAAAAARLYRAHPEYSPAQLRATLMAAADPASLPPERTGGGIARDPAANPVTADPPSPDSGPLDPLSLRLSTTASSALTLKATGGGQVSPPTLTLTPGAPAKVQIRTPTQGAGRLTASAGTKVVASVPYLITPQTPPDVPLGALRTTKNGRGVRFTLGSFSRGDPLSTGTRIRFADKLELDLVNAQDETVRTLTVPGGARELMPAEYGYTLPAADFQALPPGRYAYRARAWAPNRKEPVTRRSKPFTR
jgi:Subtilase family